MLDGSCWNPWNPQLAGLTQLLLMLLVIPFLMLPLGQENFSFSDYVIVLLRILVG